MSTTESPLGNSEKRVGEFIKETEEKLKVYSKLDPKSKQKDRNALKDEFEAAVKSLDESTKRSNELLTEINELKLENESPNLKARDFLKRKENETKKLKEIKGKLEKTWKKVNTDLQKLKGEENEGGGGGALSGLKQVFNFGNKKEDPKQTPATPATPTNNANTPNTSKQQPAGREGREEDGDEEDDEEEGDEEGENDDAATGLTNQQVKGLQELMREEKKQVDKKKQQQQPQQLNKQPIAVHADQSQEVLGLTELARLERQKREAAAAASTKGASSNGKEISSNKDKDNKSKEDEVLGLKELMRAEKLRHDQRIKENASAISKQPSAENVNKRLASDNQPHHVETDDADAMARQYARSLQQASGKGDHSDEGEEGEEEDEEEGNAGEEELREKKMMLGGRQLPPSSRRDDDEDDFDEGTLFRAIDDFVAEEEGDLDIKKGDLLEFTAMCDDPEFIEVKNQFGAVGLVPLNKLKVVADEKKKKMRMRQEEDELARKDDGNNEETTKGEELWAKAKDDLKKKGLLESEALKVTGIVPSSFSDSILGKLINNPKYTFAEFLKPTLTKSNLNLKNFYWEFKENKIRTKLVAIQKILVIHKCTNIPVPKGDELEILTRTVRICLFDGVSILSNIHTIRAHVVGRDEKTWIFEDDYSDMVQIVDFSEFFIRSNLSPDAPNLGILFELSIYCKKKNTDEESELCCGWAHIPFMDSQSKLQLLNRGYELVLNGGSVWDKNVPLDPNLNRNTGGFGELITKIFKESKIKFNVKEASNTFSENLNVLPVPLIGSTLIAPYLKYYYEEMGLHLLAPMVEFGSFDVSTEPIHSVFLASFPRALLDSDILNALRVNNNITREHMRRDERIDNAKMRQLFIKQFNELCYPLLHHHAMPMFKLNDHTALQNRQIIITRVAKELRRDQKMAFLLNDSNRFQPINIDELRYEIQ